MGAGGSYTAAMLVERLARGSAAVVVSLGVAALLAGGCERNAQQAAAQSNSIFGLFAPPKPIDAARDMVDPFDPDKRFRGTNLIANAPFGGEDVYLRIYEDQVANDPDLGVRAVAANALALHGGPEHAPMIAPLLAPENDVLVRLEAARALQRLHNPGVVPALIAAAAPRTEPDARVRAEACVALGQYAENRVLQALVAGVDDDALVVNTAARRSLFVLTGQDFGDDQRAWLTFIRDTPNPFAQRGEYLYPVFSRDKYWYEYIPLIPPPPNETPAAPAGMTPLNAGPPAPGASGPAEAGSGR